jgi:hypothetical protein
MFLVKTIAMRTTFSAVALRIKIIVLFVYILIQPLSMDVERVNLAWLKATSLTFNCHGYININFKGQ